MLLNCGVEKPLESPLDCKEIQRVHSKWNQSRIFIRRTDVKAETPILWPREELTHLKRLWWQERMKEGGERDNTGWDGWMASLTQWTWLWVNSGSWWWTGRPSVLQSMVLQRVRHDWVTELTKTSRKALFLSPSDVGVRSFLYPFYTLIKLYYTKALHNQASSLALH